MTISPYYKFSDISQRVMNGDHREVIGGLWDEVGQLQFKFVLANGLAPTDKLIDIGCGCFRGGIHFVKFLDPGSYYGIDINQSLLDAGYEKEIVAVRLENKLPRTNLVANDAFDFSKFSGVRFDFAITISMFTHLPLNSIRLCLLRLRPRMKIGAKLYASFFLCPNDVPVDSVIQHEPGGVITSTAADPYHYRFEDIEYVCRGLAWNVNYIGDWGHPRGQKMLEFEARVSECKK